MVKKIVKTPMNHHCYLRKLYDFLGKKYSLTLVHLFSNEAITFNQILRLSKNRINPTLLSQRLKIMQELGLIEIEEENTHVAYILTKQGKELTEHLTNIKKWGIATQTNIPANCKYSPERCTCELLR